MQLENNIFLHQSENSFKAFNKNRKVNHRGIGGNKFQEKSQSKNF